MKVRAVVQARMSSRRLPGKSLTAVAGVPLLRRVVERARALPMVDEVVVATSADPSDDAIAEALRAWGTPCVRGSLDDVLARFAAACEDLAPGDCVARITADNPLYDRGRSLRAFQAHRAGRWDYTCVRGLSHVVPEFVQAGALRLAARSASDPGDREHVTPWLRRAEAPVRAQALEPAVLELDEALEPLLTVDTPADLERMEALLGRCGTELDCIYDHLRAALAGAPRGTG